MALQGTCFQPLDGINLWRLVASVGNCIDTLSESTIDLLDEILCSVGIVIQLTQADFAAPLVISQPGYYKVCENITASTTLTIESDDATLDLGTRFLDGVSIIIADAQKHITIKNGLIRNVSQGITVGAGSQDITIQDLVLDTAVDFTTMYGIKTEGASTGLVIRGISFYDAAPENIVLTSASNALVENIRCVSTNQALTATPGTDATIHLVSCDTVQLNNIVVSNPYEGLDCIFLDSCDGIDLSDVNITTDFTSEGIARGVRALDSNNLTHDNVSVFGLAFADGFAIESSNELTFYNNFSYVGCSVSDIADRGFFIANGVGVSYQDCTAVRCGGNGMEIGTTDRVVCDGCTTNGNGGSGLRISATLGLSIAGHQANGNGDKGISLGSVSGVTLQDALLVQNASNGLFIEAGSTGLTVDNVSAVLNGSISNEQGILVSDTFGITFNDTSATFNGAEGFHFLTVENIILSGCTAQRNGNIGFSILGVNENVIPSGVGPDDEGVGRSPCIVEGCSAFENDSHGFRFANVGGVKVSDCFSTYNSGYGFHFDTGSWNVQAIDCIALSNRLNGFLTWDVTVFTGVSKYENRFHDCHAARNTTSVLYVAGVSDYSTNNVPGTPMVAPIGAPFPVALTMAPDPLGVVPPEFSTTDG